MKENLTPEKFLNDLFRNFIGLENILDNTSRAITFPKYEIYKNKENGKQLLKVLLAGYKKSDISIQKAKGRLVIKHEKNPEETDLENGFEPFGQRYIAKRAFNLQFQLNPNVKIEEVKFEDGILSILFDIIEDEDVVDVQIS